MQDAPVDSRHTVSVPLVMANDVSEGSTTERAKPRLSVVITNFNYARFLPVAIDSVLNQDEAADVIVVDDCSADGSQDVIAAYGKRIDAVLQPVNGGQGAGFNAGFARATGDLVMFLDADDFLLPGAVRRIIEAYDPHAAVYMFRMRYTDERGELGGLFPPPEIAFDSGDVTPLLCARGRYSGTITSGLVFSRNALAKVMPMDAASYRYNADGYLSTVVPFYGQVRAFDTPLSAYRLHAAQYTNSAADKLVRRARGFIAHDHDRYAALRAHAARHGHKVAADLGERDLSHVRERLISLMFDPAGHPVAGDTLSGLFARSRHLCLEQQAGLSRYLGALWWTLLGILPDQLRRLLFLYQVSPAARPAWLVKMVRTLKGRR